MLITTLSASSLSKQPHRVPRRGTRSSEHPPVPCTIPSLLLHHWCCWSSPGQCCVKMHTHAIGLSSCNLFCVARQAGSCAKHLKGLGLKIYPDNPLRFLKCWSFTAHGNGVPQMQYTLIFIRSIHYPLCNRRLIGPNNYWVRGFGFFSFELLPKDK